MSLISPFFYSWKLTIFLRLMFCQVFFNTLPANDSFIQDMKAPGASAAESFHRKDLHGQSACPARSDDISSNIESVGNRTIMGSITWDVSLPSQKWIWCDFSSPFTSVFSTMYDAPVTCMSVNNSIFDSCVCMLMISLSQRFALVISISDRCIMQGQSHSLHAGFQIKLPRGSICAASIFKATFDISLS